MPGGGIPLRDLPTSSIVAISVCFAGFGLFGVANARELGELLFCLSLVGVAICWGLAALARRFRWGKKRKAPERDLRLVPSTLDESIVHVVDANDDEDQIWSNRYSAVFGGIGVAFILAAFGIAAVFGKKRGDGGMVWQVGVVVWTFVAIAAIFGVWHYLKTRRSSSGRPDSTK